MDCHAGLAHDHAHGRGSLRDVTHDILSGSSMHHLP
jgi:hypothetical protein